MRLSRRYVVKSVGLPAVESWTPPKSPVFCLLSRFAPYPRPPPPLVALYKKKKEKKKRPVFGGRQQSRKGSQCSVMTFVRVSVGTGAGGGGRGQEGGGDGGLNAVIMLID